MVSRLVLVLGDQLSRDVAALAQADRSVDTVVMAEVADEASYVPHHPKKIAFVFSAMRHFAASLIEDGWTVAYTRLDDPQNAGSITGELLRRAEETGAAEILATEPGEWRLIEALGDLPMPVTMLEDTRFVATHADFDGWAEGRKELRMEFFYREMRRKTGLLMDGDKPEGGKWNFDHDNRKPPKDGLDAPGPMRFSADAVTQEVLALVRGRFGGNFGTLDDFWFATTQADAKRARAHWIKTALPTFGDYQDAMVTGERFLFHSILSMYINAGLLDPLETCQLVEEAYRKGHAPLNAAEGFIRQIIGWRDYMRGIYFREGPEYTARNALAHDRKLPDFYWSADTDMACMREAIEQTRDEAYAHHIQRLMVTGNFALLAGIDPHQVHEWYLAVYADAYEWVEAPNVIGMSQYADDGIIASKPYVSSGNYIDKMSDYCRGCVYDVKTKTGEGACPFNLLYWHFVDRHEDRFAKNPRMGNVVRTWGRMSDDKRSTIIKDADTILSRLDQSKRI
ncbi:MAG: cryptochrome/photolyase family protein [Pseudomonadota bacterium]